MEFKDFKVGHWYFLTYKDRTSLVKVSNVKPESNWFACDKYYSITGKANQGSATFTYDANFHDLVEASRDGVLKYFPNEEFKEIIINDYLIY